MNQFSLKKSIDSIIKINQVHHYLWWLNRNIAQKIKNLRAGPQGMSMIKTQWTKSEHAGKPQRIKSHILS